MDQLLRQIGEAYDIESTELVVASDHVHALCCFPPRLSVSEVVKVLKSFSARPLFSEYPELRRRWYGGQFWAGGYFVRTVGSGVDAETVLAYLQSRRDPEPAL